MADEPRSHRITQDELPALVIWLLHHSVQVPDITADMYDSVLICISPPSGDGTWDTDTVVSAAIDVGWRYVGRPDKREWHYDKRVAHGRLAAHVFFTKLSREERSAYKSLFSRRPARILH